MKTVYAYDPETFEYTGEVTAQVNPMEPEEFIMPADAVEDEPPEVMENQIAVYEGEWIIKPDFRNQTIWQDYETSIEVTEIGEIPEGWNLERPEKPLEMVKDEAINYVKSLKASLNSGGITGNIKLSDGSSHKADISTEAMINILGLIVAYQGRILTGGTGYTFADNETITINNEDCMNIGAAIITLKDAAHHQTLAWKEAIIMTETTEAVNAILDEATAYFQPYLKINLEQNNVSDNEPADQ